MPGDGGKVVHGILAHMTVANNYQAKSRARVEWASIQANINAD